MKETFEISGMSCGHCVHAVRKALEQSEGVSVESVAIGSATVDYDPTVIPRASIVETIEGEGYRVVQTVA